MQKWEKKRKWKWVARGEGGGKSGIAARVKLGFHGSEAIGKGGRVMVSQEWELPTEADPCKIT